MLEQDSALAERITAAVKDIEVHTSAELVIVIASQSDAYREAPWMVGAAAGWLTLGFLAWSPVVFDGAWFPVDAALAGGVAGWLTRKARARRWLVPKARRAARVAEAARAAFVEEAVHGTRAHTGVLVYVSLLEEQAVVLPDEALLGRVPRARWNEIQLDATTPEGLERTLRELGERLAAWLPADATDNPDELADAPRFR